jgi:hypothetical protein
VLTLFNLVLLQTCAVEPIEDAFLELRFEFRIIELFEFDVFDLFDAIIG